MLYACTRGRSKKLHSAAVMLIAAASGGNFTGLCCVLFPQHTLSPNSAVCEQIACCIALLMFTPGTPAFTLALVLALQAQGQPAQEKGRDKSSKLVRAAGAAVRTALVRSRGMAGHPKAELTSDPGSCCFKAGH
ncbi:hypothetical protein Anapl_14766 [Anas platyrhynchos]|uniref:Uncharacterized protein n=1 Tax=Anas platyrhynchos TaxID=8839 RepID=R0JCL3_ANAPL|nr:hypothetical protein Anapl_14766 [Anas platyrhynchos]